MIGGVREQVVQQLCHIVLLGTQVEAVNHQDDTPAQRKLISQLKLKMKSLFIYNTMLAFKLSLDAPICIQPGAEEIIAANSPSLRAQPEDKGLFTAII